jgi:hypothetical protein
MTSSHPHRVSAPSLLIAVALTASSQTPQGIPEYQAKATILRALGNYTRWPAEGTKPSTAAFTIGILGSSPFGHHLEAQVRGQQVRGRSIRLLPLRTLDVDLLATCDMLFICESESDRISEIIAMCRRHAILTLGDTPGYGRRGVMLNFRSGAQVLELEANLQAIRAAGLEVSSSFLTISKAKIVESS